LKLLKNPFFVNTKTSNNQDGLSGLTFDDGITLLLFSDTQNNVDFQLRIRLVDKNGRVIGKDKLIEDYFASQPPQDDAATPVLLGLSGNKFAIQRWDKGELVYERYEKVGEKIVSRGETVIVAHTLPYPVIEDQGDLARVKNKVLSVRTEETDSIYTDIVGSFIKADGSVGKPFTINTTTVGYQEDATVAALDGGKFVVAWVDFYAEQIRYQLLDPNGRKIGSEGIVLAQTSPYGTDPVKLVAVKGGGFALAYAGGIGQGSFGQLNLRTFDSKGKEKSAQLVNLNPAPPMNHSEDFAIARTPWGGFVVGYDKENIDIWNVSRPRITVAQFTSYGRLIDDHLQIDVGSDGPHEGISITIDARGDAIVGWTESNFGRSDKSGTAVKAVVVDVDRAPIEGSGKGNAIKGKNGRDVVFGNGGNDNIHGIGGDDSLYGDGGNDAIAGGLGKDRLYGGKGNDRIDGGAGNDWVVAGDGIDTVDGGAGNDEIHGEGSADSLSGGGGTDLIYGGEGNDAVRGGKGNDRLYGERGNDTLAGDDGNDVLDGGEGNNTLSGGAGRDMLVGGEGRDILSGGAGADQIYLSGTINPDITGNIAASSDNVRDIVRYASVMDSARANPDTLFSFEDGEHRGADRIDLSAIDANPFKAGDQPFVFVSQYDYRKGMSGIVTVRDEPDFSARVLVFLVGDTSPSMEILLDRMSYMEQHDFIL
jgi:hypothetical protein